MASFRKKLVILFGIILIAISMGYYFGIYLPNKKSGIVEQQKQEQPVKDQTEASDCQPIEDYDSHYDYNFEDFSIVEKTEKPSAPLLLKSNPIGLEYRTRITEAYKEGPNYGGHYTVAEWGCGTECQRSAIVDNWTGKIIGVLGATRAGVEYDKDSRLIVANMDIEWLDGCKDDIPSGITRQYYTTSNDGSKLIELPDKKNTAVVSDGHKGERVEWYGKVAQFSGSGSLKFFHYDIKNRKVLNDEKNPWFWGSLNDDQLKYVEENRGAVFMITGVRNEDDCGYYALAVGEYAPDPGAAEGVCLADVNIEKIEVVK